MLRRRARWIGSVALLPLLALAVSAPAYGMFCHMLGTSVVSCCCPSASPDYDAEARPLAVRAVDCCELRKYETAPPSSEIPTSGSRQTLFPIVAVDLPAIFATPDTWSHRVSLRQGAPPAPPPLIRIERFLV